MKPKDGLVKNVELVVATKVEPGKIWQSGRLCP